MANHSTADLHVEEMHWAFTTLSYFDAWCGATCHAVSRYVLRCLLVLTLAGTLVAILMRSIDPKRCWKVGLGSTSVLLNGIGLGSLTRSFSDDQMGIKDGNSGQVLSGGPDLKDSCAVM